MSDKKIPDPEDIQREFEDFVQKRFGKNIQVFAQELPSSFLSKEKTEPEEKNDLQEEKKLDEKIFSFNMKPKDLKEQLDRFIIGQDEARKALSIAVCDHYNQVSLHHRHPDLDDHAYYAKQNVLVLGPTGVGKTCMIRHIAEMVGVPFVKADATRFSETGYMGANVDDLIRDLVTQADGNIQLAQYGIVYLDEVDKLAQAPGHVGRDVSGRGVQLGLLKLMEDTDIDLRAAHDPASQMQIFMEMQQKGKVEKQLISTRHILFIVSGAFTGLETIVSKRLNRSSIGFDQAAKETIDRYELLAEAMTEDFVLYGFEPEFVGRLPVRVACHPLDEEKLFEILKHSEGSIIRQYKQAFHSYGIHLSFEDAALREIARQASREETGARSLMTICEKIFRCFKYELPSSSIQELVVSEDVVRDPAGSLQRLLRDAPQTDPVDIREIRLFEENFFLKYRMKICFSPEARNLICQSAQTKHVGIGQFCQNLLENYEHALMLISQKTGVNEFILKEDVVRDPKQALEVMVRESCIQSSSDQSEKREPQSPVL